MVLREEYEGDVHISTGMTTKEEVRNILEFWEAGKGDAKNRVVLYNCTSGYPVPFEDVCLLELRTMQEKYGHRVKAIGFSGHHLGIAVDVAAHALGATWVERHFTRDRTWKGTDHAASLEPAGLGKLCRNLQNAWKCMSFKKQDILPIEAVQRGKLKWGEYNADMVSKLQPSQFVPTILPRPRTVSQKEPIVQSIGPVVYRKPMVMAEIGCNHKGDKEIAKELLTLAKKAGADYGKFQKRNPKEVLTEEQYNAPHPNPENSYGDTYGEHRENLELTVDDHRELQAHCNSIGLEYSCSVWDTTSARDIVSLNPKLIKVGSPSNQHWEMQMVLREEYEGDVHISTGMTTKEEVRNILEFWEAGKGDAKNRVVLYNCTSGYPVPFEDVCLLDLPDMVSEYGHRVKAIGFSGHHLGISTDVAAYALGASWVERHFTKDRTWKGTDHAASLEYTGLSKLCRDLQVAWKCMSYKKEEVLPIEKQQRNKLKWGEYNQSGNGVTSTAQVVAPVPDLHGAAVVTYREPKVMAEIGCNHMGDKSIAKELLSVAKDAGADVAKFQKRNPKELLTAEQYAAPHPNPANSYGDTYGAHREFLELSVDVHRELKEHCDNIGLVYSCSVWDVTSAREIISLKPELIKVGSPSNQHWEMQQLLRDEYDGEVHISTGMTTRQEVERIVQFWETEKGNAKNRIVLYNCTSGYPVPFEDVCLLDVRRMLQTYSSRVKAIGFSGHHLGIAADVAAYSLGATWIERHFTKDRTWKGTDHAASLEPEGIQRLCRDLQAAWLAMDHKKTEILPLEEVNRRKLKWGLYNK